MGRAVLCWRNPYLISGQRLAVELRTSDPATNAAQVLDRDFVTQAAPSNYHPRRASRHQRHAAPSAPPTS
jgi:hypothetical protein